MEFGQDATLQKVREEMCNCVRNFAGVEDAKDMSSAANLGEVVGRAAEWLRGKAVLLVCVLDMSKMYLYIAECRTGDKGNVTGDHVT